MEHTLCHQNLGKAISAPRGSAGCCSRKSGGSEKTGLPYSNCVFFYTEGGYVPICQEFRSQELQEFRSIYGESA
jgi:hypothetical protein